MSFSSEVKWEIASQSYNDAMLRPLLSGFMHINSSLQIVNQSLGLAIRIENAMIAKAIFSFIKRRYQVDISLTVARRETLKKNNIYTLEVGEKARDILSDLCIMSETGLREAPDPSIVTDEESMKVYLAGAFLASGSINAPTSTNYHMEIAVESEALAEWIQSLLTALDLEAKITHRRQQVVVYMKKADLIADFLKSIGAIEKTFEFEDVRIQRDFKNSLTRLNNTQLANDLKSMQASTKQLDAIYALIKHNRYNHLDQKLIDVAELRMNHPDASLNELLDYYEEMVGESISKSGLQHRFNKILELGEKLI